MRLPGGHRLYNVAGGILTKRPSERRTPLYSNNLYDPMLSSKVQFNSTQLQCLKWQEWIIHLSEQLELEVGIHPLGQLAESSH